MNNLKKIIKEKYKKEFLNKILEFSVQNLEIEQILEEINYSWKFFKTEKIDNKTDKNFDLIITNLNSIKKLKKNLSSFWEILIIKKNWDFEIFKNEEISKDLIVKLDSCLRENEKKNENDKNQWKNEKEKWKNNNISLEKLLQNILKSWKFHLNQIPKKALILKKYKELLENWEIEKSTNLEKLLIRKKIRSLSWVLPITLMTKPWPCPWDCIFCPDDTKMPKSYMSEETTSQRALRQEFNSYDQVIDRLKSAKLMWHKTEKAEIIILWWTFPAYAKNYQKTFVKWIFKALNWIEKNQDISLKELQKINETSENKCVWLSVEIRPDTDSNETLSFLRELWVTRIEMWVQSLNNEVLELNRRGHKIEEIQRATKNLKQFWFKVMYHMMMWLPWSSEKIDKKSFKDIFSKKYYHPDQLKIYPCLVLKWTELAKRQEELNYQAFWDEEIIKMTKYIKKETIPFYTRIARITRDVPAPLILNWSKSSNIREKIEQELKKEKIVCKCIRCREIRDEKFENYEIYIEKIELENAKEFYIEARSEKSKCLWLIRLYLPEKNSTNFKSLDEKWIIRELHVYGKVRWMKNQLVIASKNTTNQKKNVTLSLSKSIQKKWNPSTGSGWQITLNSVISTNQKQEWQYTQHLWFWEILIKKAEEIAKKEWKKWLAIISAIWTKWYYRKFWYKDFETYMSKEF